MKTKKTNNAKRPHEANFRFPCGDFQEMAEMMKSCCPGEGGPIDCCSMMRRVMECGGKAGAKKQQETPKGRENG